MEKIKYEHKFSLRVGEIAHVNGIPCEYLGMGNFGTNTYPGRPSDASQQAELKQIVDEQAEDEGLWFVPKTAPEEYLQKELRRLHAKIERLACG